MAYEDPPFRPDLTRVDVRPEFADLIVDCWCDDPEERPHFFRIVERLKKISGRSVHGTLPIIRLRRSEVMIQCNAMLFVHIDVQSFTVQISKVVRISVISR